MPQDTQAQLSSTEAFFVLNRLPGMGPITASKLMRALGGDPVKILSASKAELKSVDGVGPTLAGTLTTWKDQVNLEEERDQLRKAGVRFTGRGDEDYPKLL